MRRKVVSLSLAMILAAVLHSAGEGRGLMALADELKAGLKWDPWRETGVLLLRQEGSVPVLFQVGSPWMLVDYRFLYRIPAPVRSSRNGEVVLPEEFSSHLNSYLAERAKASVMQPRVAVILIDPGHGGKDAGAIGFHRLEGKAFQVIEKDVVLKVGLKLHELLRSMYPDKKILLTRQDDSYLRLEDRTELANTVSLKANEAVIFVSLHANASFNREARGFEVWYLPSEYRRELIDPDSLRENEKEIAPILNVLLEEEYTVESITLAREVLAEMSRSLGNKTENRGLKAESWFVVRNARMPSILVELGFVTNAGEAVLLAQEEYLLKLAQALYTGITRFVRKFEHSKGFTE